MWCCSWDMTIKVYNENFNVVWDLKETHLDAISGMVFVFNPAKNVWNAWSTSYDSTVCLWLLPEAKGGNSWGTKSAAGGAGVGYTPRLEHRKSSEHLPIVEAQPVAAPPPTRPTPPTSPASTQPAPFRQFAPPTGPPPAGRPPGQPSQSTLSPPAQRQQNAGSFLAPQQQQSAPPPSGQPTPPTRPTLQPPPGRPAAGQPTPATGLQPPPRPLPGRSISAGSTAPGGPTVRAPLPARPTPQAQPPQPTPPPQQQQSSPQLVTQPPAPSGSPQPQSSSTPSSGGANPGYLDPNWYFGHVEGRGQAEDILSKCSKNAFLIRQSSIADCFALSKYVAAIQLYWHFIIARDAKGEGFVIQDSNDPKVYSSLDDLVKHSPALQGFSPAALAQ